jgi:hypothetical protein
MVKILRDGWGIMHERGSKSTLSVLAVRIRRQPRMLPRATREGNANR